MHIWTLIPSYSVKSLVENTAIFDPAYSGEAIIPSEVASYTF